MPKHDSHSVLLSFLRGSRFACRWNGNPWHLWSGHMDWHSWAGQLAAAKGAIWCHIIIGFVSHLEQGEWNWSQGHEIWIPRPRPVFISAWFVQLGFWAKFETCETHTMPLTDTLPQFTHTNERLCCSFIRGSIFIVIYMLYYCIFIADHISTL